MKIALVHDYLREYGGAERVVEALHEIWPQAPLYTAFVDWETLGNQVYRFRDWDIRTAPFFLIPGIKAPPIPGIKNLQDWILKKFHSPLRFLAPKIWESFDLSDYDVVISSSGWYICRGVVVKEPAIQICYIHHPPRNLYGYATGSTLQKYWPVRVYATIVNFFLRHYDYETAQKVDYFIANSEETARRVEKFYRRESTVVYPPVEISQGVALQKAAQGHPLQKRGYYLSVGRLTYSKRVDLAIEACNQLKLPLKIVGTGKEGEYLQKLASQESVLRSGNIEFLGSVSDEALSRLYAGAKALIFCALDEDFGMVPVEAMAHGTPVIALAQGGVLETVVDGNPSTSFDKTQDKSSGRRTGILFSEPTTESLIKAIKRFNNLPISSKDCIEQAKKFSKERFKKELKKFVEARLRGYD